MKYTLVRSIGREVKQDQLMAIIIDTLKKSNSVIVNKDGIITFRKRAKGTRALHLFSGKILSYKVEKYIITINWQMQSKFLFGYNLSIIIALVALYMQHALSFLLLMSTLIALGFCNYMLFFFGFRHVVKTHIKNIVRNCNSARVNL